MLSIDHLSSTVGGGDREGHQFVEPEITPELHVHIMAGTLHHQTGLHRRGARHRLIGNLLQLNDLRAHIAAIGCDQHLTLGISQAVGQGCLREATVDHTVRRTNFGAGQHHHRELGDAGQVDRDDITLLHPDTLQHVGHLTDLAVECMVREGTLATILALPDDGQLVLAPRPGVTVDRIVDDIGLTADEPLEEGLITIIKQLGPGFVPLELPSHIAPELLTMVEGPLLELLVAGETLGAGVGHHV